MATKVGSCGIALGRKNENISLKQPKTASEALLRPVGQDENINALEVEDCVWQGAWLAEEADGTSLRFAIFPLSHLDCQADNVRTLSIFF